MKEKASIFLSSYKYVYLHVNGSVTNSDSQKTLPIKTDSNFRFYNHINILWQNPNLKLPVLSRIN